MEKNKIYNEDCLVTMRKMEDNSVDLIVTSPPYNKGFYASKNAGKSLVWGALDGRKIGYDKCDDDMPPAEYERWQKEVITECMRVLKPSGNMFYNHKDVLSGGLAVHPKWVYDFNLHQVIVWDRGSSPAIDVRYFFPITEYVFWLVKEPKKNYFDKEKATLNKSIWRMNTDKNPHPAPFPLVMARNIVACASPVGGVIYDPFMGSGTTALAVLMERGERSYIGSEISDSYIAMAESKLKDYRQQLTLF